MSHSLNSIHGKFKSSFRACFCALVSAALIASLTPLPAFADSSFEPQKQASTSAVAYSDSDLTATGEEGIHSAKRQDLYWSGVSDLFSEGSSAKSLGLFVANGASNDSKRVVKLKEGTFTRWIDRVEFPEAFREASLNLYDRLVEASDNDGVNDFLIDDKYVDPSRTDTDVEGEFANIKDDYGRWTGITIADIRYSAENNYQEYYDQEDVLDECVSAVLAAFDRDHPEVFWIGPYTLLNNGNTVRVSGEYGQANRYQIFKVTRYLVIGGFAGTGVGDLGQDDIRSVSFGSASKIKDGISVRDSRVKELTGKAASFSDAAKVRFFNQWLTHSNAYNSRSDLSNLFFDGPLSYECLSALIGCTGSIGPVCEGYARAFKVLCDAAGIPCALADGQARTNSGEGAHMWNIVYVDDVWYSIDVTWNDPGSGDVAYSGHENETYFLVGSETREEMGASSFAETHILENRHTTEGLEFTNQPEISGIGYSQNIEDLPRYVASDYAVVAFFMDLSRAQVDALPNVTYNTRYQQPVPRNVRIGNSVLVRGRDYRLSYSNNRYSGTGYAILTGIGSCVGTLRLPFKILPLEVQVASVSAADGTYTGSQVRPAVKVQMANTALVLGRDYTVSTTYSNNTSAGVAKAVVTVSGIGSCTGVVSRTVNFKILPKKMSLKKVASKSKRKMTISWSKAPSKGASGYQIRYCTSKAFKKGVKTVTVKKASTASKTISKLKSKKRYYVQIRAYKSSGGKLYGAWSSTKSVKVR